MQRIGLLNDEKSVIFILYSSFYLANLFPPINPQKFAKTKKNDVSGKIFRELADHAFRSKLSRKLSVQL